MTPTPGAASSPPPPPALPPPPVRRELEGDTYTWNRVISSLKLLKDSAEQRGAGMVVAVVQEPENSGDLPPERVSTICHNLSLDPRCADNRHTGVAQKQNPKCLGRGFRYLAPTRVTGTHYCY